jgi:hypothetical protein
MARRPLKPNYAVAMSKDTGCIVMVKTNGKDITVMGSMSRDESLKFVKDILAWSDETIRRESRLAFNH